MSTKIEIQVEMSGYLMGSSQGDYYLVDPESGMLERGLADTFSNLDLRGRKIENTDITFHFYPEKPEVSDQVITKLSGLTYSGHLTARVYDETAVYFEIRNSDNGKVNKIMTVLAENKGKWTHIIAKHSIK